MQLADRAQSVASDSKSNGSHGVRNNVQFFRSFLSRPREVGAVLPTSASTVRAMLDMADVAGAQLVVELGAGTGVFTEEILRRLGPGGRLVAFEIDATLAADLQRRLVDPRLRVVNDTVERLDEQLGGLQAQVIVSALPFTSLPKSVKRAVFGQLPRVLAAGGVMLQIQYSTLLERELRRTFASVSRRFWPLNVPPAFLFACRHPLGTPDRG